MLKQDTKISVIGAGSWGTALACLVARAIGQTIIYSHNIQIIRDININKINVKYLPEIKLPSSIQATNQLSNIIDSNIIIIAVPSKAFTSVVQNLLNEGLNVNTILLIATKGMCAQPLQLFSEYIESICANKYGFISGPNLANEVALDKLAALVVTMQDKSVANIIAKRLMTKKLQTYSSSDIVTVQIASLVKNIVAIKAGMMRAINTSENALAWLVSAGLQEIELISSALGGKSNSLSLPSVIGDLVLTSYSQNSRNYQFGYKFSQKNYQRDYLRNYPYLVEGIEAVKLLTKYLQKRNIKLDLPVIYSVRSKLLSDSE